MILLICCLSGGAATALPDGRVYEMVSPPYKGGYGVDLGAAILATEENGNRVEYMSFGAFNGLTGGPKAPGYMALRTDGGWSSVPLVPPAAISPETIGNDLSRSFSQSVTFDNAGPNYGAGKYQNETDVFLLHDTSLPDTEEYFEVAGNIFLTSLEGKPFRSSVSYVSGSPDLCHLVLDTDQPLLVEAEESQQIHNELYELDQGCSGATPALRVVGLNNESRLISPRCEVLLGLDPRDSNAIADEGSEIYFTANVQGGEHPDCVTGRHQIFDRISGSKTIEVSRPLSEPCDGVVAPNTVPCEDAGTRMSSDFAAASEDGSHVVFTTSQRLTGEDLDSGNDVYMAGVGCPGGPGEGCESSDRELTEMSQVSHDPRAGQSADVLGVVRVAPDGKRVYFVAEGDLLTVTEEARLEGEGRDVPTDGAANLYVYELGTNTTKFVTDLCSGPELSGKVESARCPPNLVAGPQNRNDTEIWEHGNAETSGQDARYLVFASYGRLVTGDADTAADVYRYDAVTGRLDRISIGVAGYDANGNRDGFDATIGLHWGASLVTEKYELASRAMSEDGTRIVFSSAEPLSPSVSNGDDNIYEWQEGGGEGEVGMISTGTAGESDAEPVISPPGGDVFFTTVQGLVKEDTDGAADVYDARRGGGFPPPQAPRLECLEACQGPLSAPAPVVIPGSESQQPGENAVPAGKVATTNKKGVVGKHKKANKKRTKRRKSKARKAKSGRRKIGGDRS
ncbi:MAG: hypothetical protein ACRDJ3_02340 [Solirubrobacteraceae bacterium]